MSLVVTLVQTRAALTELKDTGNLLDGVTCKLFQNDYTPSPNSVIGDFTVADFTGYATSAALVWAGPVNNDDGTPELVAQRLIFTATDAVTPNTIYGYYLLDSGGALLGAERFETPQQVAIASDSVIFVPRVQVAFEGSATPVA